MNNKKETITGLSVKGEAILVYLISILGFIFSFMKEEVDKEARWVYNQAGAVWIINIALTIVKIMCALIPVLGIAISVVCNIAVIVLFVFEIIALVKAYDGVHYEIPLVSEIAKAIWKNDNENVVEAKYEDVKPEKEEVKSTTKTTKSTTTKSTSKTTKKAKEEK